ncbi:DUF2812 domain-containing protein [Lacticaseibacillus absianus]|uniref:DUF2812 domain-containing protein n=1 Tax=Lacticaseibacillus absianus TaxID=2729623 RepID=UPI0015C753E1|nr:DUF2812 domain-containing protein [Lacticaseibacillus absianus]
MKQTRVFWVYKSAQEAHYLTAQLHAGWRVQARHVCRYTFVPVPAQDGVIRLDYQLAADLPEYTQLMQDAGWTLLMSQPVLGGRWLYWQHADPTARIYTDQRSHIALLRQLRRRWTGVGLGAVALEFVALYLVCLTGATPLRTGLIGGLIGGLAALYGANFVSLTRQIRHLEREQDWRHGNA